MMKRALIVRHVPYEGVAGYREPIEAAGYVIDRVDARDPGFDALDFLAHDLVVLMGGPMGVYERDENPWLTPEIERVEARLAADRPTLGVCLGAQIMAAALRSPVYPGPCKEVGFAPVTVLDPGGPLGVVAGVPVLHWHGDTFDLPPGTERLASTAHFENQAFRRGPNLLALQFHAEMGEDERFFGWVETSEGYIADAGTDAATLIADHERLGPDAVAAGRATIAAWLAQLRPIA